MQDFEGKVAVVTGPASGAFQRKLTSPTGRINFPMDWNSWPVVVLSSTY